MHPWEDFAETFAHYLHITGTAADAAAIGIQLDAAVTNLRDTDVVPLRATGTSRSSACSPTGSGCRRAFNRINRAMGFGDLYPFDIVAAGQAQARLRARPHHAGAA